MHEADTPDTSDAMNAPGATNATGATNAPGAPDATLDQRLVELLVRICDEPGVADERDEDLFEAGLLDSMAAIELLVALEEGFGVVIAPTAVEREDMNTVNKIIAQVKAFSR
ncbi:MAG: D-alanine--poly(phosphoribitol) ligase subunit DltC [Coriobacteriales bacterium]|jgi:D-alanine--poly(phosphoribitol) ligase subunit 2|nr:D-alanine--poly(phosphoribitol) ligase subunit DltC [Coriobacteriales bacterium]